MSVHTLTVSVSVVAVVCVLSGVITNRATEGGNAHIECPYDRGYETNQKYLSKGSYRDSVVVIQTQKHQHPAWIHQGRYSLYDNTERRVFTVTITNLILEDADIYWCGVSTWGHDQPTEVRLTVVKGWCLRMYFCVLMITVTFCSLYICADTFSFSLYLCLPASLSIFYSPSLQLLFLPTLALSPLDLSMTHPSTNITMFTSGREAEEV
uniref:Immunoglobulin domain-containing protein n=1 Tax=Hucho hucho TaxID=62062 RepID=A0A4W5K7K6_9TELE